MIIIGWPYTDRIPLIVQSPWYTMIVWLYRFTVSVASTTLFSVELYKFSNRKIKHIIGSIVRLHSLYGNPTIPVWFPWMFNVTAQKLHNLPMTLLQSLYDLRTASVWLCLWLTKMPKLWPVICYQNWLLLSRLNPSPYVFMSSSPLN